MIRNILAVIAGSAVWTVLWLGYNALLKRSGLLPFDGTARFEAPLPLGLLLAGSIVFSVVAGYVTAMLARVSSTGSGAVWTLAVLQLAFGIFAEVQFWHLLPLWYHLLFLLALVPATVFGGQLRRR
jgi:hypothetical protein